MFYISSSHLQLQLLAYLLSTENNSFQTKIFHFHQIYFDLLLHILFSLMYLNFYLIYQSQSLDHLNLKYGLFTHSICIHFWKIFSKYLSYQILEHFCTMEGLALWLQLEELILFFFESHLDKMNKRYKNKPENQPKWACLKFQFVILMVSLNAGWELYCNILSTFCSTFSSFLHPGCSSLLDAELLLLLAWLKVPALLCDLKYKFCKLQRNLKGSLKSLFLQMRKIQKIFRNKL